MKKFSKKDLRKYLLKTSPSADDEVLVDLVELGFRDSESDGWIVNPYWSDCGTYKVDPVSYYGMDFLDSPIATMLGFILPSIIPSPKPLLAELDRLKYESSLMERIRRERQPVASFYG